MGSNTSKSESTPLNGAQRADIFNSALSSLNNGGGFNDKLNSMKYEQPEYADAGAYKDAGPSRTLSGGDYDKLQQSFYKGDTAGLDEAWQRRKADVNQSMSDRGVWASGAAEAALRDEYAQNFTPAYERAGANAAQQRYAMQGQEQQALNNLDLQRAGAYNTYNMGNAQMRNQWNTEQAGQKYNAQWRPVDYLAGLWNGTGGVTSSGQAGGWSI